MGPEFLVNTVRSGDQQDPAVGRQPDGGFLVAWESDDANNTGIFAQLFDFNGVDVGQEFLVNNIQENNQEFVAVGAWSGGYVVAWESFPDGEGRGIFARRFDSNGVPLGDQFLVNTIQDRDQRFPSVSVFDGGEFVIVWQDDDIGSQGQEFDAAGEKLGQQFDISLSDKIEEKPRVQVRAGGYMPTWFGAGEELDTDVFARLSEPTILASSGIPPLSITACAKPMMSMPETLEFLKSREPESWNCSFSQIRAVAPRSVSTMAETPLASSDCVSVPSRPAPAMPSRTANHSPKACW